MAGTPAGFSKEASIASAVMSALASRPATPHYTYNSRPYDKPKTQPIFLIFLLTIAIHFFDLLTRLSMQSYPIFHFPSILMYVALAIICSAMKLHDESADFLANLKFFALLSALAYMIPFVNYLGVIANLTNLMIVGASIRTIVGFGLLFAPIYPLYFMYVKPSKWTSIIGAIYMIFWVVILIMGMAPTFQTQGQIMGINVGEVYYKTYNFIIDGSKAAWHSTVMMFTGAGSSLQSQIDIASGGNYGNVQQGSAGFAGMRISGIKKSQEQLIAGEPVSISALLETESIKEETELNFECGAKPTIGETIQGLPTPSAIIVQGRQTETILCDFPSLEAGPYSIFFDSNFKALTRWNEEHYFMDSAIKLYDEAHNIDPLANIPAKKDEGFSQGAINIGTGMQRLTGISQTQAEMPWSVSFSNRWSGIISSIDSAQFLVPKGFTITSIDGYLPVEQKCQDLPQAEIKSCDDSITNVYSAPAELISKIKNVKLRKDFNIRLGVDPAQIIKGSLTSKEFAVLATYNYKASTDAYVNVNKP